FGGSGDAIADELKSVGIECIQEKTMADAVKIAVSLAKKGDAVLLSPGCASFDEFDNFEHRGHVFGELVSSMNVVKP
ncbi:MAG: UDP-N-acetylmuramoyl-L-alanine--D-glutamate ligase, partial [Proteobacteria bacterium]|nr:UDP-N-acetylmuramoyl-L-alanine--D-glutamate ligase [Pseudomonadota bacterium]